MSLYLPSLQFNDDDEKTGDCKRDDLFNSVGRLRGLRVANGLCVDVMDVSSVTGYWHCSCHCVDDVSSVPWLLS